MNWLECDDLDTHDLDLDDITRGCTDLLIFMAKDFLEDKPLGNVQRQAMEMNARHVEHLCCTSMATIENVPIDNNVCINIRFFYYLKSLAGMMKCAANGFKADEACKKVIHEHVDVITEMLDEDDRMNDNLIEDSLSLMLIKLVAII